LAKAGAAIRTSRIRCWGRSLIGAASEKPRPAFFAGAASPKCHFASVNVGDPIHAAAKDDECRNPPKQDDWHVFLHKPGELLARLPLRGKKTHYHGTWFLRIRLAS